MHKIKNNPISSDDVVNKKYVDDNTTTKQDKTDNALDTTDKTVVGSINELNKNFMQSITFKDTTLNITYKNGKVTTVPLNDFISGIIAKANLFSMIVVDALPTVADNGDGTYTITYVQSGKSKTTKNENTWFLYNVKGTYKETMFVGTTEITRDAGSIDLSNYVNKLTDVISTWDFKDLTKIPTMASLKNGITDTINSSSTSTDIASAKGVYDELNKKIDKTSIVAPSTTSTNKQVVGAKTYYNDVIKNNNMKSYYVYGVSSLGLTAPVTFKDVWDKIDYNTYFVIDTDSSQITDLPHLVSPSGTVTNTYGLLTICKFKERTRIEYKRCHTAGYTDGAIWFGDIVGGNCSNLSWYRAYVYKHDDNNAVYDGVSKVITFKSTTNYKQSTHAELRYIIINGICYVSGGVYCVSPSSTTLQVATLPRPKGGYQYYKTINITDDMKSLTNETNTVLMLLDTSGWFGLSQGVADKEYRFTFSYPIA